MSSWAVHRRHQYGRKRKACIEAAFEESHVVSEALLSSNMSSGKLTLSRNERSNAEVLLDRSGVSSHAIVAVALR